MARVSANMIGLQMGKNAKEVNQMLEEMGYIEKSGEASADGSPAWTITELGKKHGGSAHDRYSNEFIWDLDVSELIKKHFNL